MLHKNFDQFKSITSSASNNVNSLKKYRMINEQIENEVNILEYLNNNELKATSLNEAIKILRKNCDCSLSLVKKLLRNQDIEFVLEKNTNYGYLKSKTLNLLQ